MPARVRFVAAAGPTIGRGHLARALSLAETGLAGDVASELELQGGPLTSAERRRADASGLRVMGPGGRVDPNTVVVIDVPEPTGVAARFDPSRLAVFDDRETLAGRAAVVIQPSLPAWGGGASVGGILAGYEFAPVSAAIRERRDVALAARGHERPRVFTCLGGSDPELVTERLVGALAAVPDVALDVVVGATYAGPTEGWPIEPLRDPDDFVDRLASADVAVLGAGTIKFEAACLGRPMVLVAAADDQVLVGPPFSATGAARYLGDGRSIDPGLVAEEVRELLSDRDARHELGATAARIVDGRGAERIMAVVSRLGQSAGNS
jgi:hypothetical protein